MYLAASPRSWPDSESPIQCLTDAASRLPGGHPGKIRAAHAIAHHHDGGAVRAWVNVNQVSWVDPLLIELGDPQAEARLFSQLLDELSGHIKDGPAPMVPPSSTVGLISTSADGCATFAAQSRLRCCRGHSALLSWLTSPLQTHPGHRQCPHSVRRSRRSSNLGKFDWGPRLTGRRISPPSTPRCRTAPSRQLIDPRARQPRPANRHPVTFCYHRP